MTFSRHYIAIFVLFLRTNVSSPCQTISSCCTFTTLVLFDLICRLGHSWVSKKSKCWLVQSVVWYPAVYCWHDNLHEIWRRGPSISFWPITRTKIRRVISLRLRVISFHSRKERKKERPIKLHRESAQTKKVVDSHHKFAALSATNVNSPSGCKSFGFKLYKNS